MRVLYPAGLLTDHPPLRTPEQAERDIAARRMAHLKIKPVEPIATGGRPAEKVKSASDETYRNCLAVHMAFARPASALR
jgi:hypothetical protein